MTGASVLAGQQTGMSGDENSFVAADDGYGRDAAAAFVRWHAFAKPCARRFRSHRCAKRWCSHSSPGRTSAAPS